MELDAKSKYVVPSGVLFLPSSYHFIRFKFGAVTLSHRFQSQ
jgi:hypothetical protein